MSHTTDCLFLTLTHSGARIWISFFPYSERAFMSSQARCGPMSGTKLIGIEKAISIAAKAIRCGWSAKEKIS